MPITISLWRDCYTKWKEQTDLDELAQEDKRQPSVWEGEIHKIAESWRPNT